MHTRRITPDEFLRKNIRLLNTPALIVGETVNEWRAAGEPQSFILQSVQYFTASNITYECHIYADYDTGENILVSVFNTSVDEDNPLYNYFYQDKEFVVINNGEAVVFSHYYEGLLSPCVMYVRNESN